MATMADGLTVDLEQSMGTEESSSDLRLMNHDEAVKVVRAMVTGHAGAYVADMADAAREMEKALRWYEAAGQRARAALAKIEKYRNV